MRCALVSTLCMRCTISKNTIEILVNMHSVNLLVIKLDHQHIFLHYLLYLDCTQVQELHYHNFNCHVLIVPIVTLKHRLIY